MLSRGLTNKQEAARTKVAQRQIEEEEEDPRPRLAETLSPAAEAMMRARFVLGDADPQVVLASWFEELTSWQADDAAPFVIAWDEH